MRYVIDPYAKPPAIVHIVESADEAREVAQRYATQTGHATLVALGPTPGEAPFLPIVPEVSPVRTEVTAIEARLDELKLAPDEWDRLSDRLNAARERAV
jgi:hypothetical protein